MKLKSAVKASEDGEMFNNHEDNLTVLRLVPGPMLSLVDIRDVPRGEGNDGGFAIDGVLDDLHDPVIKSRVNEHTPDHLGVLAVVIGEFFAANKAIRPLPVRGHGGQHDIDKLVQV